VEDNGLEAPHQTQGNQGDFPVYAINPTRAQFAKIIEAIQDDLSAEQLQTLATIARQFAPKNAETMRADNAFSQ
jgi:hypothetical protein